MTLVWRHYIVYANCQADVYLYFCFRPEDVLDSCCKTFEFKWRLCLTAFVQHVTQKHYDVRIKFWHGQGEGHVEKPGTTRAITSEWRQDTVKVKVRWRILVRTGTSAGNSYVVFRKTRNKSCSHDCNILYNRDVLLHWPSFFLLTYMYDLERKDHYQIFCNELLTAAGGYVYRLTWRLDISSFSYYRVNKLLWREQETKWPWAGVLTMFIYVIFSLWLKFCSNKTLNKH